MSEHAALLARLLPDATLRRARNREVYPQQAMKEALLEALPRAEAFRAYAAAIAEGDQVLAEKPLLGLLDAARRHGQLLHINEAEDEAFTVLPPPVFGEGNQRALQGRQRARYLACFPNARVRSRSSAVEKDAFIAFDFDSVERAGMDDRRNLDPALFDDAGDIAYCIPSNDPLMQIEQAFSLVGPHSWAFGHWMWEFLPRYLAACLAGLPPMPVLVDAGMPPQHRQSLKALLPDGASLVELPARSRAHVGRLWVAPTPMYMPQFERMNERFRWDPLAAHPGRFALIVEELNRRVAIAPAAGAKLYFARREIRHRKMLNHAQIEALAMARGFQVLYPEDLDFEQQVAQVRGADHIVGPEGSAMFLAFFARPGTRVGILNHPYTAGLPVLTGLLDAIGLQTTVLTGPARSSNTELPHFIDYDIDPRRFSAFLDGSLAA